jgi:hypothetical protein
MLGKCFTTELHLQPHSCLFPPCLPSLMLFLSVWGLGAQISFDSLLSLIFWCVCVCFVCVCVCVCVVCVCVCVCVCVLCVCVCVCVLCVCVCVCVCGSGV